MPSSSVAGPPAKSALGKSPVICPVCGRDAPIVYRGVVPYCTACGALRAPLATPSINLAGKSKQVGGTVASVAGWLVLLIGLSLELGLALLLAFLFSWTVAFVLALPLALISTVIGVALLRSGRSLRHSGVATERAVRDQAILSMAGHHGPVTATDAARLLNVTIPEADAMLTELAKRDPDRFSVDIDDQGVVWYRLANPFAIPSPGAAPTDRVRVDAATEQAIAEQAAEEAEAARRSR
jgi:hypothetical protein